MPTLLSDAIHTKMEDLKDEALEGVESILEKKEGGGPHLANDLAFNNLTIKDVSLEVYYETEDDEELGFSQRTIHVQFDEEIPEEGVEYTDEWKELKEFPLHIVLGVLQQLEREM